jgi:hypothetical protein
MVVRIVGWLVGLGEFLLVLNLLTLLIAAFVKRFRGFAGGLLFFSAGIWALTTLTVWCAIRVFFNHGWLPTIFALCLGIVGIIPVAFFSLLFGREWLDLVELLFQAVLVDRRMAHRYTLDADISMSRYQTTSDAVKEIMRIIEEEGDAAGAVLKVESSARNKRSNKAIVSAKVSGNTFRITITWIRDEAVKGSGDQLGFAYIETDWDLKLEPESDSIPLRPPFVWRVFRIDRGSRKPAHPGILDETWLRALIRQKLRAQPRSEPESTAARRPSGLFERRR